MVAQTSVCEMKTGITDKSLRHLYHLCPFLFSPLTFEELSVRSPTVREGISRNQPSLTVGLLTRDVDLRLKSPAISF